MSDLNGFAERYIAMWNEGDADKRDAMVEEIFAPEGRHYTPTREFHGTEQLKARIKEGYDQWVKPGVYVFRAVPNANGHHGTVRFNWEMVEVATNTVTNVGFDFITLDGEDRILSDHQFIDR